MITQLRIDERLIHGQIVTQWSRYLDVSMIVVANDKVANDELAKKALLMTAPAGKKVRIRTVDETIQLLQDPRAENIRMLLIVNNPDDAVKLTEALHIKEVNVANYTKKKAEDRTELTPYIFASKHDLEMFRKLVEVGDQVYTQMIPSTPKVDMKDILKKFE